MPYIKSGDGRREALQRGEPALTAGELNYQIFYFVKHTTLSSDIIRGVIEKYVIRFLGEKPNYQRYNDFVGALINCYIEIKRRLHVEADILLLIIESYAEEIAKYEDVKILENGDVE
jgi:hypothetical protein